MLGEAVKVKQSLRRNAICVMYYLNINANIHIHQREMGILKIILLQTRSAEVTRKVLSSSIWVSSFAKSNSSRETCQPFSHISSQTSTVSWLRTPSVLAPLNSLECPGLSLLYTPNAVRKLRIVSARNTSLANDQYSVSYIEGVLCLTKA